MGTDILTGIKNLIEARPEAMALLPGLVWTRSIKPNAPGETNTPGATPEAFLNGRIQVCASIQPSAGSQAQLAGPKNAYWITPEIVVRCMPHASEKLKAEYACIEIMKALDDQVITGLSGEGLCLSLAGHIGPFDDPIIEPAVLYMVRVQVDSIWKT
jgi:hypothetical protein